MTYIIRLLRVFTAIYEIVFLFPRSSSSLPPYHTLSICISYSLAHTYSLLSILVIFGFSPTLTWCMYGRSLNGYSKQRLWRRRRRRYLFSPLFGHCNKNNKSKNKRIFRVRSRIYHRSIIIITFMCDMCTTFYFIHSPRHDLGFAARAQSHARIRKIIEKKANGQ